MTDTTRDETVLSAAEIERIIDAYVRVRVDFPSDLTTVTILGKGAAASSIANRLASVSAPASGRVDAVAPVGYMRAGDNDGSAFWCSRHKNHYYTEPVFISPAAPPVSEAGGELSSAVELMKRLKRVMEHERRFGSPMPNNPERVLTQAEGDIEEWLIDHGHQHSDDRQALAKATSSPKKD